MIKNECKIVKDLLPNYVEDLISKETKEFVENHIENCKNCKDTLALLKGDKKEEEQKEEKSEEQEIKHLKKYNRKMTILKSIAAVLAIFIIASLPITIPKKIKEKKEYDEAYVKGKYVYDIVQAANNKLKELKNEKNLEMVEEHIYYNNNEKESKHKDIYKYKDEKFSYINISYHNDFESEFKEYGIVSEDMTNKLEISKDFERAVTFYQDVGNIIRPMISMDVFDNLSIIDCSVVKIVEEEFNRKGLLCIKIWNRGCI